MLLIYLHQDPRLAIMKKILDVLANPNGGNKVCMIKPYNVIKIKMLSFLFSCKVVATNFCVSSSFKAFQGPFGFGAF